MCLTYLEAANTGNENKLKVLAPVKLEASGDFDLLLPTAVLGVQGNSLLTLASVEVERSCVPIGATIEVNDKAVDKY